MLRVAILSAFPDRLDSPAGGVQAVARNLALGLGQRGDIDLHVVTSRPGLKQSRSVRLAERITVHSVPRLGRLELPTLFLHDRLVLGQVLRRLQADVVHAHEARYAYVCGAMRSPYLLTVHGFWSTEEQTAARSEFKARARLPLVRLVEGRSIQRAQVIVANSRYVLRQLSPSCRAKAIYIPNPVDPLFYAPGPPEPRPGRIIWVGRLIPLKAVDVLLQALPAVRRAVPTAHLRLVGPCPDAAYAARIRAWIEDAGLAECVELVGPRHGVALRAEYASAAVLAVASLQENVPMSIAEAMAVGRPVVATDVGGVAELVQDGVTGRLCPAGDSGGLARALLDVLSDQSRQQRMGLAARASAEEKFHHAGITARHASVYHTLASGAPACPDLQCG